MKNCDVAECGSLVRAIAIVPGVFRMPALLDDLRFVDHRGARGLLLEVGREAAALDHEAVDDAVELRAVVVLRLHVLEEVRDGLRCRVGEELDADLAGRGVELDLRVGCKGGRGETERARRKRKRDAT